MLFSTGSGGGLVPRVHRSPRDGPSSVTAPAAYGLPVLELAVLALFSGACPVQRCLPWRSLPCSAVLALFSGACRVQRCLPWRSLPCSAVLDFAVSDLFSSACHGGLCPVQQCLPCSAVLDFAVSDLCSGVCHGGPSLPSGAVAAGVLLGTDSGGGLLTSDDGTALLGTDSGGGLLTSDDGTALLGTDSGGGVLASDDRAGGGLLGSWDDGGLLRRAALPRLCRFLLPLPHLGRSHS
ncbi:hypothetical protein NDU88_003576 [Pleurodeles waltl]|uniref:Uncharacterized protein n=1 Tax=Pleurodeles waltl TaxID=8319 RepID=A0AAV7W2K2_PLEWA|nr:hypothetical protein NDU88_003576 [Pleurodeles waltl]